MRSVPSGAGAGPAGPAAAVPIFSLKKKKKKKTSVSLEDSLSFSRGLSSVVCLSWKIQSIEKKVEGSAGYRTPLSKGREGASSVLIQFHLRSGATSIISLNFITSFQRHASIE